MALRCFILWLSLAFLQACTVSHTKDKLVEAQQVVGLKNQSQLSRWHNIQLDKRQRVIISNKTRQPELARYAQELERQLLLHCPQYFADCGKHIDSAGYRLELQVLEVTMTKPNPESKKPVQVKHLSWLVTVKDAHNQHVLDKLTAKIEKSLIHRDAYNLENLLSPSVKQLFQELSYE